MSKCGSQVNVSTEYVRWMSLAHEMADQARQQDEVPVGAIVVLNGEVVGRGHNRTLIDCDPTAHAEIIALRQAAYRVGNHRLVDSELFVTLEPCAMCAGAILQARVALVVFGARDPKSGSAGSVINILESDTFNHRCQVVGGVMERECASILRDYFALKR